MGNKLSNFIINSIVEGKKLLLAQVYACIISRIRPNRGKVGCLFYLDGKRPQGHGAE